MGPILTTHAGSLPRPPELDRAWARHFRGGPVDRAELDALVRAATVAAVTRQATIGIDLAGDGEQGRESFFTHVRDRFAGFGGAGDVRRFHDVEDFPLVAARRQAARASGDSVSLASLPAATEEVTYLGTGPIQQELDLLRAAAAGLTFAGLFVTVPSPGIVATAMTNRYYPTIGEYVDALAVGLAQEYAAVLDAGFVLQIDAPDLAMERHVLFGDRPLEEFVAFADHVLSAIDRALGDRPRDRVRLHVCWGNYDGPHTRDVPLAEMLPLYASAQVGALVLSLSNPRHAHEYRLLGSLPGRLQVVAGCIDTTSNYVEHPEVVADRLLRVVEAVGDPARVTAGTYCGFGTTAGARDVAGDVAWSKLASLVEGARLASERLSLV